MTAVRRVPIFARLFAAVGLVASIVGGVGAIALRIADPAPVIREVFGFGDVALVGFVVMGAAFASVGALLVVRRPSNAVGWCMVVIGFAHAVGVLAAASTFSLVATGTDSALRVAQSTAWLTGLLVTVGGVLLGGIALIFPTGRGHTRRWDRLARASVIAGPITVLMLVFQPGPLHIFPTIENPLGFAPDLRSAVGVQYSALAVASLPLVPPLLIWSLVSRYRLADAIERQQLKWFVLAIATSISGMALSGVGAVLFRNPPEAGLAVFGFAGALVPVAIGIAILRDHLYDIDKIISRTLSYAVVTGVLGAVFAATAIGLSALLASVAEGESLAVAASTLLVLALFGPFRRRAQSAVDRRFDRAHFDASLTVQALTERLRDDVDLERVEADVLGVVDRTLHPTQARLWLRGSPR